MDNFYDNIIDIRNDNLSGYLGKKDRLDFDTEHTNIFECMNQEQIKKYGIDSFYIAIEKENRDDVLGDNPFPIAKDLYKNIRLRPEDENIPAANNIDSQFDFIGWIDSSVFYISKKYMKEITEKQNNNNNNGLDEERIPKPGDIIVLNIPEYYPTLEITDVDDDAFHYLNKRPNWIITTQTYTRIPTDFTYIQSNYEDLFNSFKELVDYKDENQKEETFQTNKKLEKDERNMNSPEKKGKDLFDKTFGDWDSE